VLEPVLTTGVGLVAGALSAMTGIGGGLLTTPAIRLILGYPGMIAVGTSLFVVIPTAAIGLITHMRRGNVDFSLITPVVWWGIPASIAGAWTSSILGSKIVLLAVAVLICVMSIDIMLRSPRAEEERPGVTSRSLDSKTWTQRALGLGTGFLSGLLGIGGGIVLVPVLIRYFRIPVKLAVGTSLAGVLGLSIPGAIVHHSLGHVEMTVGIAMAAGTIPGAALGSWVISVAPDRIVRTMVGLLLIATSTWLVVSEMMMLR